MATNEEDVSDEDEAEEIEIEKKRAEASRDGIDLPKDEAKSKKVKLDKSFSDLIAIRSQRFESIEHALNNGKEAIFCNIFFMSRRFKRNALFIL